MLITRIRLARFRIYLRNMIISIIENSYINLLYEDCLDYISSLYTELPQDNDKDRNINKDN